MIGEQMICAPRLGEPLNVFPDIWEWLRAGRNGIVMFDWKKAARHLEGVSLSVETIEFGQVLPRRLARPPPRDFRQDGDEGLGLNGSSLDRAVDQAPIKARALANSMDRPMHLRRPRAGCFQPRQPSCRASPSHRTRGCFRLRRDAPSSYPDQRTAGSPERGKRRLWSSAGARFATPTSSQLQEWLQRLGMPKKIGKDRDASSRRPAGPGIAYFTRYATTSTACSGTGKSGLNRWLSYYLPLNRPTTPPHRPHVFGGDGRPHLRAGGKADYMPIFEGPQGISNLPPAACSAAHGSATTCRTSEPPVKTSLSISTGNG